MKECKSCGARVEETALTCPKCGDYVDGLIRQNMRCTCGNLLAKIRLSTKGEPEAVEIKCRRCKAVSTVITAKVITPKEE
jgi:phage FluMu protein Com